MKNILLVICSFFAIISFSLAKNDLPKTDDPMSQKRADKQLKLQNKEIVKLVVDEVSKKLPQKVDNYTQYVSIKAEGLTLISTYEINIAPKSDEAVINEDKSRMETFIIEGICQSSKRFLQSDINVTYVYTNSSSKKELFRFGVTAKDCIKIWEGTN
ncbi:MAG: hypothetical protein C0625_05620 [Arcobacter sp.]|nr:MAG: hypothetical protein C0625_05620 [Arcobacter sp.]